MEVVLAACAVLLDVNACSGPCHPTTPTTEIDLIDYRGSTSEIKLARFFVQEASVLKVMRFGVLLRNNEWRADHRKHLSLNDKVSAEAEFVFETSSCQRLENLFAH